MNNPGHPDEKWLSLPLYLGDTHPCPYLPGRVARNEFTFVGRLDPAIYQQLMDMGFRRSGLVIYRPTCTGCRECVPIRIPVDLFRPSRSQRRSLRKNRDVTVEIAPPMFTTEKWRVYSRYLRSQHDGTMSDDPDDFKQFLYFSATDTLEMTYRVGRRVIGVGIVDVSPCCLSSVYFYFDPDESWRSLGVYGALREIQECRRRRFPFWYLGFYVKGCRRMNYKSDYRPFELMGADGLWTRHGDEPRSGPGPGSVPADGPVEGPVASRDAGPGRPGGGGGGGGGGPPVRP